MVEELFSPGEAERLAKRKSLGGEVFEILRDKILAGEYPLGEWLRQEEIGKQLGVSQTPVREALDRLVAEGLAERVPYRGVRVSTLTSEEIADIYAARLVLEVSVARAAAYNITDEQLARLKGLVNEIQSLRSLEEMSRRRRLNIEFHFTLARASKNQVLERLYRMTLHQFPDWMIYEGMFRQEARLDERLGREIREHREILSALREGDSELAAERAGRHIRNLKDELMELLGVPAKLLEEKERGLVGPK
jgi:DNA-binding GntR family transcriptional regulator